MGSSSNTDTMIPTARGPLLCALLLCALDAAVRAQRGRCSGTQCFALIQRPTNFSHAEESCRQMGGQLLLLGPERVADLLHGLSGSFWLSGGGAAQEAPLSCPCCSVSEGRDVKVLLKPCSKSLDGFLCQSSVGKRCTALKAGGGALVKHTAALGFELKSSDVIPVGATAVTRQPGAKYPESKHLCFEARWIKAPWPCEVFQGGCEHGCNSTTNVCACPAQQLLHPNRLSCAAEPCAACAHECQQDGDARACKCRKGFRLARDEASCVDVDECKESSPCKGENEKCVNTEGGFRCACEDGLEREDGKCVADSCVRCEHLMCNTTAAGFQCHCKKGFKVSAKDPYKCELDCTEKHCPAICAKNPEGEEKEIFQCYCPEGYIQDVKNKTAICSDINECDNDRQCDHVCENTFGGYRCLCNEGFRVHNVHSCVAIDEGEVLEEASGSSDLQPSPAGAHPAAVPSYIKTGSVLGISVFLVMCAALLYFLLRVMAKRCGRFKLSSLKHHDIDIFYLQQVTTETYKRLSFDKQFKNDSQKN